MTVKIEAARKAVGLRARLDKVDAELRANPGVNQPPPGMNLWFPGPSGKREHGNWSVYHLMKADVEAIMVSRRNRLTSERFMILAEAAELGLSIEDEPKPAEEPAPCE